MERHLIYFIIFLLGFITCRDVLAEEGGKEVPWRLLSAETVNLEVWRNDNHYNPYIVYPQLDEQYSERWLLGAAFNLNIDVLKLGQTGLYWDNRVEMHATTHQPREVSWEYEAGFQAGDVGAIYYWHRSEHIMDRYGDGYHFPLQDRIGVRINLLRD